jgi:hypothetical protein
MPAFSARLNNLKPLAPTLVPGLSIGQAIRRNFRWRKQLSLIGLRDGKLGPEAGPPLGWSANRGLSGNGIMGSFLGDIGFASDLLK